MNNFVEYVTTDLLRDYDVKAKAMFGGYGLSIGGVTFGMIVDDVLYFKVDNSNKSDYEKYDMQPFMYIHKSGKKITMNYYEVPPTVVEDNKLLSDFLEKSLAIAKANKK